MRGLLVRTVVAASFFVAVSSAFAQQLEWGVKAGVPATDYFDAVSVPFNCCSGRASYTSSTNRYTVGPAIEISLPLRLGVEVDTLYKRYRFRSRSFGVDTFSQEKTTANSWEFPLLLKYKPTNAFKHTFIDAGRHFTG